MNAVPAQNDNSSVSTRDIRVGFKCPQCRTYVVHNVTVEVTRRIHTSHMGETSTYSRRTIGSAAQWDASRKALYIHCQCGQNVFGENFKMSVSAHKCGAKCISSKGHICECSCGGANHGRNYQA